MPPRPKMRLPTRRVLFHSRASFAGRQWSQQLPVHVLRRQYADKRPIEDRPFENPPAAEGEAKGPNMDPLPHISEEAAATKKSMGEEGPEIDQGTPVTDAVKGDKAAEENLPKVMKDQINKEKAQGKRSFSTLAGPSPRSSSLSAIRPLNTTKTRPFSTHSPMREQLEVQQQEAANMQALQELAAQVSQAAKVEASGSEPEQGLKFAPPATTVSRGIHLRKRYDTVVDQVTRLLMRDGKLSIAQRNMNTVLSHLRTSPAPRPSERAPLVANAPAHSTLPLDPIVYLTVAIDSVAPLFRLRSQKGIAGGGVSVQIPVPLGLRQRRRTAVTWILDQVEKRKGGLHPFPKRFADELVAIVEGRSTLWERRNALHVLGMRARVNLNTRKLRKTRRTS